MSRSLQIAKEILSWSRTIGIWILLVALLAFTLFGAIHGIRVIAGTPTHTPAVYLLSPQEYTVACPEWTPPDEIPLMWVVRYVKDGELHEIPTYSEEERDGLIEYLKGERE